MLLTVGVFLPGELARRLSAAAAVIALGAAAAVSATQFEDTARFAFDHTVRIDAFGQGARMLIFVSGLLAVCVAFGMRDLRERGVEYHALLLSACAGMSLLAVANSFVTTFVALELFSICLYVLVAIETDDLLSLEGGLKYLIVGSIGAAFLLYGGALVYGATGQLEFDRIRAALANGDAHGVLLLAGIALVAGRPRLQGERGAVPHVDAGRLRGRAHPRDRVHVGGDQGGRARDLAAGARHGVPAPVGRVGDRPRRARLRMLHRRQPRRAPAGEREADARVLHRRALRLPPDRGRRRTARSAAGRCSTT